MIKKFFSWFAVVFVMVLVLSPFLITQFLIKVKIECLSQFGQCPLEVNSKLEILNSKNLWQTKSEIAKILKKDSLISDFSMQYKLPNILQVNLLVKKPMFAIKDASLGKIFTVDATGNILSEVSSTTLPMVVQNDQMINTYTLNLMLGIYQMYQVGYGTIVNDALVVDIPNGLRVIFPVRGDEPEVLLGALRLIYSKVTTEYAGVYSEIDMRYKNPVLR
jgi:hypothetical protein